MTTHLDPLHLRRTWGRGAWLPPEEFGPDGWSMRSKDGASSIIVTVADLTDDDPTEWVHASIAHRTHMPTYDDLVLLHQSVWKGRGWAYQVFPPDTEHVNIHHHALHLFGRLDGQPVLPIFNAGAPGFI